MRLRTKLILSYALVVLLAIVAVGALALPLLQDYQNKRYEAELDRLQNRQAGVFDQVLRRLLFDANNSPFKPYFPPKSGPKTWPAEAPAMEAVRETFTNEDRGLRIIAIRVRDGQVLIDTEGETAKSLVGFSFGRRPRTSVPTPAPGDNQSPPPDNILRINNVNYLLDQMALPNDSTTYNFIVRPYGLDGPNLFGLNNNGRPVEMIYAAIFPPPPQPNVFEDMLLNLLLAGLAALIVSLVAGLLLARSISRPLVRLTKASEAVAKGDYSHTVRPEGGYELARLTESFNHMSREVEQYQRMQRELIGNVSHELKTPLTTILGFSQAMLDGALRRPEDFASSADIIHSETERMIRLVNSLLELSRLESGQVKLARNELDLQEILERVVTSFGPRAEAAQVKLITDFAPLPLMQGDADRLRQVFNNLIDNALKYTPVGGQVTVACRSNGRSIVASVTDTGVGIPEEDLQHIFERFYQANKARSREVEGIGLGLAITREIVHGHGGKIEAQSKVGQGTRFTILFPALAAGPAAKGSNQETDLKEKALSR
jgi:signal transduction histidine kinase